MGRSSTCGVTTRSPRASARRFPTAYAFTCIFIGAE